MVPEDCILAAEDIKVKKLDKALALLGVHWKD